MSNVSPPFAHSCSRVVEDVPLAGRKDELLQLIKATNALRTTSGAAENVTFAVEAAYVRERREEKRVPILLVAPRVTNSLKPFSCARFTRSEAEWARAR